MERYFTASGEEVSLSDILLAAATAEEWRYAERARKLARAMLEFRDRFFEGGLTLGYLWFDRTGKKSLCEYVFGESGVGSPHRITVNVRLLEEPYDLPWVDVLASLLHALVHQWQQEVDPGRADKLGYRNREFRRRARSLGLVVERNSYGSQIVRCEGPIVQLLKEWGELGPEIEAFTPAPIEPASSGDQVLFGCRCDFRARARELPSTWRCARCGELRVVPAEERRKRRGRRKEGHGAAEKT